MTNTLHFEIMKTQALFQRAILSAIQARHPGITPGQPKVLEYLLEHPRSMQREIAEGCIIEPPTLTRILKKMKKDGLILQVREEENLRTVLVELTGTGKKTARGIRRIFNDVEAEAWKTIAGTPEEILLPLLRTLQKNLAKEQTHA